MAVTEDGAKDRQTQACGSANTGKAVAQIVEADIAEPGFRADTRPWPLYSHQSAACPTTWYDVGITLQSRRRTEKLQCCGPEENELGAGLGVGKAQGRALEVDLGPAQRKDLVSPGTGQQEQPDRQHDKWIVVLLLLEHYA